MTLRFRIAGLGIRRAEQAVLRVPPGQERAWASVQRFIAAAHTGAAIRACRPSVRTLPPPGGEGDD